MLSRLIISSICFLLAIPVYSGVVNLKLKKHIQFDGAINNLSLQDIIENSENIPVNISFDKKNIFDSELTKKFTNRGSYKLNNQQVIKIMRDLGWDKYCRSEKKCNWKIPHEITIENLGSQITEELVKFRLKKLWNHECEDCNFNIQSLVIPNIDPEKKYKWELRSRMGLPKGAFSAQIHILDKSVNNKSRWVSGYLRIFKRLPVVSRNIMRGESVKTKDVIWKNSDITFNQNLVPDKLYLKNKILRKNLSKGEVIWSKYLAKEKVVKVGSSVKIILDSDHFQVSFVGQALQSGAVGERIKVKNKTSRKIISGIIDEHANVKVQ